MYKGKKRFSRKQLLFIVEVMITSAVDTFEGTIKQSPSDQPTDEVPWLQELGWNLSILYAQLTGDGMAGQDALELLTYQNIGLDSYLTKLQEKRNSSKWKIKQGDKIHNIPIEKMAENFVDTVFDEYLKEKVK